MAVVGRRVHFATPMAVDIFTEGTANTYRPTSGFSHHLKRSNNRTPVAERVEGADGNGGQVHLSMGGEKREESGGLQMKTVWKGSSRHSLSWLLSGMM